MKKRLVFLSLSIYYLFMGLVFFKPNEVDQFPILKQRLGTILWHPTESSEAKPAIMESHLYCYYPGGAVLNQTQGGEDIIKRAKDIKDCSGWKGMVILEENSQLSEREKLHPPVL